MKWLVDVIELHAQVLDLNDLEARQVLADAIIQAIPGGVLVEAIASATSTVLRQRGLADPDGELTSELARNSAQTVLALLLVGGDPDNELAIPEAIAR